MENLFSLYEKLCVSLNHRCHRTIFYTTHKWTFSHQYESAYAWRDRCCSCNTSYIHCINIFSPHALFPSDWIYSIHWRKPLHRQCKQTLSSCGPPGHTALLCGRTNYRCAWTVCHNYCMALAAPPSVRGDGRRGRWTGCWWRWWCSIVGHTVGTRWQGRC